MANASEVIDRTRVRSPDGPPAGSGRREARRQLLYELTSGASGLFLAVFMWGHMFFVGSILLGTRGFDWIADGMERIYVAQPTVILVFALFVIHAAFAARKIPAQLRERRRFYRLAGELRRAPRQWLAEGGNEPLKPHVESWLWIWQVRTGMVILVLGSFHLILMALDVFTDLFGDRVGIEAVTSMARTGAGLVWLYGILLLCVEFHAGIGLYRLAIKWGIGARFGRAALYRAEKFLFWFFIGLGLLVLVVLAGWVPPPLGFVTGS